MSRREPRIRSFAKVVAGRNEIRDAAKKVRDAVDAKALSWRSLNQQVQWAILQIIADALTPSEIDSFRLDEIRESMEDGTPTFWQRFFRNVDVQQRAQVRAAVERFRGRR